LPCAGITEHGGHVVYKANVKQIITEGSGEGARAVGVKLADGRVFRGKTVISNATRWDTFEGLMAQEQMPESERLFRWAERALRLAWPGLLGQKPVHT
jgi:prolycopene isomerase